MKVNFLTNNYREHGQNFNGRTTVFKQANSFANEILNQATDGKLSVKTIKSIIRQYIPGVDVISIPTNKKNCQDIGGYFRAIMSIDKKVPSLITEKRIIYLRKPPSGKSNFIEYILSIIHEMTHAFQSVDDKLAEDLFITNNLSHLPTKDWHRQISLGYRTFTDIEADLFKPAIFAHRGLSKTTPQDGIYSILLNPQKFKKVVFAKLNNVKKENPYADMTFLKKLMAFIAKSEVDAYKMDVIAKARIDGTKIPKEGYFIPDLYRKFASVISEGGN